MFTSRLTGATVFTIVTTILALAGSAAQAAPAASGYTPPSGIIDPCPAAAPGTAGCAALTGAGSRGSAMVARNASATATPAGYSPANLQQAYELQAATSGSGQTVAVVTAYNAPDAASDMAAYRGQYGLPACTVADKCFTQVSQAGSTTTLPGTAAGWSVPVSESLDMISGICPNCHIVLVEASSSAITDLGAAENEAVTLGAKFIDNDWDTTESPARPAGTPVTSTTPASSSPLPPATAATAPATPRPRSTSRRSAAPLSPPPAAPRAATPKPRGAAPGPAAPPISPSPPGRPTPAAPAGP